MDILTQLTQEFKLKDWQVKNTIELIDQNNTIPFIARYRKEMTGTLSDEVLRQVNDRYAYLLNLEAKKEQVEAAIKEQAKWTKEIEQNLAAAMTLVEVEDIYRPYKQKKRTRATIAKERGLEPLAEAILAQDGREIDAYAQHFINPEKEVLTGTEAIAGAKDITCERIADETEYRMYLRHYIYDNGRLVSKAKDEQAKVYEMYFDYDEAIKDIVGHRILALNRGEKEKVLSVKMEVDSEACIAYLRSKIIESPIDPTRRYLEEAIDDAFKRLIFPAIERELRSQLTEQAGEGAITVFSKNLVQLLLQSPITGKTVLALDPAFRTGCKVAVIDGFGNVLQTGVVYPTPPHNKIAEAGRTLLQAIQKHKVDVIAIGNGTASRETEKFTADLIRAHQLKVKYVIVNEAGASVYSASELGTKEFPEFDVALRSAVSIGRRLQDPLAELVKIEPKSIGVGQYQHDMNQKRLGESLTGVVEACVNKVGVDINTASAALLSYVSGITPTLADNIIAYRDQNGRFLNRRQLLKVAKLGPKAFEQCAGFLRIREGDNPLDNTGVHPEAYDKAAQLLQILNLKTGYKPLEVRLAAGRIKDYNQICQQLDIGLPTLRDIIKELEKPGRDPRDEMPKPVLRNDVLEMKDLKEDMMLKGTVRNVIDFGAFVDIGVHQDGLVHISQICRKYIKHPLEAVAIGDVVSVKVLAVDIEKKRISLSMLVD